MRRTQISTRPCTSPSAETVDLCIDFLLQYADRTSKTSRASPRWTRPTAKAWPSSTPRSTSKKRSGTAEGPAASCGEKTTKKGKRTTRSAVHATNLRMCTVWTAPASMLQPPDKEAESAEKKAMFEAEEFLRIANISVKELEKENEEVRGVLLEQSSNYSVKVKRSPLYLATTRRRPTSR